MTKAKTPKPAAAKTEISDTKKLMSSKIVFRSPDSLTPYHRNSRTHSPEQVAQIVASIKKFGFTNPVLIDAKGMLIAGHGRAQAALEMELKEIPCIVAPETWTDADRRAYVIADNALALKAGWDKEILKLELHALDNDGFDLALVGFSGAELSGLMFGAAPPEPKDPDENQSFGLYITLDSEQSQNELFSELKARGLQCKLMN